jgi:hypothetical protein
MNGSVEHELSILLNKGLLKQLGLHYVPCHVIHMPHHLSTRFLI